LEMHALVNKGCERQCLDVLKKIVHFIKLKNNSGQGSNRTYGNHHDKLNMVGSHSGTNDDSGLTSVGHASLGLRYENGHWSNPEDSTFPGQTWVEIAVCMLSKKIALIKFCPRYKWKHPTKRDGNPLDFRLVTVLTGAATMNHVDTLRNCMDPNYMIALNIFSNDHFSLTVDTSINFRSSIVRYNGALCIPLNYTENKGFHYICLDETNNTATNMIKDLQSEGCSLADLRMEQVMTFPDFAINGIKDKCTELVYVENKYKKYGGKVKVPSMSVSQFLDRVERSGERETKVPAVSSVMLSSMDVCHKFDGWRHCHKATEGSNPMVTRIHMFTRPVREVQTSCYSHNAVQQN